MKWQYRELGRGNGIWGHLFLVRHKAEYDVGSATVRIRNGKNGNMVYEFECPQTIALLQNRAPINVVFDSVLEHEALPDWARDLIQNFDTSDNS